ncbi:MAG: hypothetical protein K2W82_18210 [Candidatus Obscuribacterales bacterium]|nr:hypothetical protein [Candidatus Obscuribacterales bacterium]
MSTENQPTAKLPSWLAMFGVAGWIIFKYKVFLFSFVLSFGLYAMRYGWPYAVALIALLYIHEMGHFVYMKWRGLDPQAPVFIPFLGAYVAMNNLPQDRATHAWSALAGPFVGGVSSVVCFYYGLYADIPYLITAAYFGIFLNLIQLVPMRPLDGGFIAQCVASWLLVPCAGLLAVFGFITQSWFLVFLGVIGIFQSFKGQDGTVMTEATAGQKTLISLSYVMLIVLLAFVWLSAGVVVSALK